MSVLTTMVILTYIIISNIFRVVFQIGDRVVALPEWRAWSELVAVPAKNVFAIPEGLNFVDAAALATNYIVAYVLLFELGAVKPGSSLILHSAGGGVVSSI